MIYMHFDIIDLNKEETKLAEESHDVVNTDVEKREYEVNSNQVSGLMVDNQGWFAGNKKKFFPYSKRDEKQVLNPDFCQGGI